MRTFNVFQRETGVPVAGRRTHIELDSSRDSRYLVITATARVAISVANATAVRNRGSVFALFPSLRLSEAGSDTALGDPRAFAFASEFLRGSQGTHTRLASPNIGTTTLIEQLVIPFETLRQVMPRETRYRVRNPAVKFRLSVDMDATPIARILDQGGATVVIDQLAIDVQQHVAEPGIELPQFAPRWSEQFLTVSGSNAKLPQEIDLAGDWIRGITVIQEDTVKGLVADIIKNFQLRTDRRIIIGEDGPINWLQFARSLEFESGGNIFAADAGAIVHLDFATNGRLANLISPRDGDNLRFLWDCQPTAAPVGSSQIKLLLHRQSRDETVGEGGRRVVDPELRIPA